MKEGSILGLCLLGCGVTVAASIALGAEIRPVGVLENNPGKYSRCVAISEDGVWVVGNSKKMDANLVLCDWPFYWSAATGMQDMGNPGGGNSYVTACASLWNGQMVAAGNVGGMARKWFNGSWSILPGQGSSVRSVYCISRDEATQETWIGGSSYPAENEKAYRYRWSNNSYIDFWGYYQDVYGIAHNGWGVGKNNWGNGQTNPDWRYDHPIFIFDWMYNCAGGGNCGWDQLKRFAGYGDGQCYKGRATAIAPSARWAVGYLTYNPSDLGLYHAFKWQVPANPQPAPEPGLVWPRPIDLGALPGDTISYAYCVSDHATNPVIGGTSYLPSRGEKAVYWDNAGVHDLAAVLQNLGVSLTRWPALSRILGISANGQVLCGYGYYDDDNNPATPAVQMGFVANLATCACPPAILQQPLPQSLCAGGTAQFFVDAAGEGTIGYQWQKNQMNLSDGGHYAGVTTTTLTISNADAADVGNYRCIVSNAYGSVSSSEAPLAVASGLPPAPMDGLPTADAADRITWKWADVSGETGYRVKDAGGVNRSGDLAAAVTQWQETGLTPNTPYARQVHAFNGCGESVGAAGQSRYTLAAACTYGTGTTSPTVYSDRGPSAAGLSANASVTFTATNGFGDGANKVSQFGCLWDQTAGDPASWTGESIWSAGTLVKQVGAGGSWYLHLRSYNSDTPKAANPTVLNLGPYTVGAGAISCLQNPGFENGFASGVGNNWTKYNYAGNVTCTDGTSQVRTGAHSQQVYTPNSGSEGGVYQRFDAVVGATYTVRVWMKVSSSSNGYAYLGVDPYGGTDSHSGNIVWNGSNSTSWVAQTWSGQACGSKITVFLDMSSTNSSSATGWFDDAEPACGDAPDVPADGTPIALSTGAIRWVWTDVVGETGYRVKDAGGINLSGDLPANATQWDETTGIAPNTLYTRRIHAFNGFGESAGSPGQSRYSLIETPTGVTFGTITATSIDVSPAGTLSNLTAGTSGGRTSNTTAGTSSGWVQSQGVWTCSGLSPNTPYTFVARARNGESVETTDSPAASRCTLSVPPGPDSVVPSTTSPCVNGPILWTAAGGFGPGTVQYYRWAWDQSPTHAWTDAETQWSSGTIPTWPTSMGTWYLHVKGYNAEDVGNGTYDYAVTVTRPATVITQQPLPQTAYLHGTARFTVAATGEGSLTYRWQKNGVDLSDGGHYSGTATDVLTISNADSSDATNYRCVVTGGCGSVTSNAVDLTVGPTVQADRAADADVDLADFAVFQHCFNGPNRPAGQADCGRSDLDGDSDVDLSDFAVFQGCFNGPNRPPRC